jgi:outer membrane biosynthesis protein TonB
MRIQIKNVSAGASFKLPGGVRVRKGGTISVPQSVLSRSYVRSNIIRGRLVIVRDALEDETTAPAPVAPPEPTPEPAPELEPEPEPAPVPEPAPEPAPEPEKEEAPKPRRRGRRKKTEEV